MLDPLRLRSLHGRWASARARELADQSAERLAEGCVDALARMAAHAEAHRAEIEGDGFGSFRRFLEVYAETLARFEDVVSWSFALDAPDPGGLLREAEGRVARALPFVDARAFALRALCGAPPFDPPGGLARGLLDLRAKLADFERLKQRAFAEGWRAWGGLVFRQDAQAATLLTAMGDPATFPEVASTPFEERIPRLRAARRGYEASQAEKVP